MLRLSTIWLALLLGVAGVASPVATAEVTAPVVYRVTLQTPGPAQPVTITYRTGDDADGGDASTKESVTLAPFAPWERQIMLHTRWDSAYPMVSVFSNSGGQFLGEIISDGRVVGSGSVNVLPSWTPSDAPYGTDTLLTRATLP